MTDLHEFEPKIINIADIRTPETYTPAMEDEVNELINKFNQTGEFPQIKITIDNQLLPESIAAYCAAIDLDQETITATVVAHRGSGREPEKITWISIKLLRKAPINSTIYGESENVDDIIEGFKISQQIDPLTVYKTDDNCYEILRGNRRFDAGTQLMMDSLPCIIIEEKLTDNQKLKILLTGNRQREKTPFQKGMEARMWEEIFRDEAKQVSGKKGQGLGAVRDRVAKEVGLGSGVTYDKLKVVMEAIKTGHPEAEKAKQILNNPTGKIAAAYNLVKPEKEPKPPKQFTSVEQESKSKQKELGLGKWNGDSVLPDMGRNEGDPSELVGSEPPIPFKKPEPKPQPQQIPLHLLEELKNKVLESMELGKNNQKIANQAIENFIKELSQANLVEPKKEAA